jgi:hypothetical protein
MFTTTGPAAGELPAVLAPELAAGADAEAGADADAGAAVGGAAVGGAGVAADEHAAARKVRSTRPATPRAAIRRDGADMATLLRL